MVSDTLAGHETCRSEKYFMRTRWILVWEQLRESFWFLPSLMVLGTVAFSFVTINLDRYFETGHLIGDMNEEGYRQLLTTVASSMIGLAGVIFSITILTLSLASQQFGPRLLRNFIRNRANQFVLGTFISTFVFCVSVIRVVGNGFVPNISVVAAMLMGLLSIGVLVFFFHHTAISLQASSVVEAVSEQLFQSIETLYPESVGRCSEAEVDHSSIRRKVERLGVKVVGERKGFIQSIDMESLMELAEEHNLVIRILLRPGKYGVSRAGLARVLGMEEGDEEKIEQIRRAFIYGRERQHVQDIEFSIEQLVEVAVRALSSSVNDPFTALACLERLGAVFCRLGGREFPSAYRYDQKEELRLIADQSNFSELMAVGFSQIRQYGKGSVAVITRMLEILEEIADCVEESDRRTLWNHAGMICRAGLRETAEEGDRRDIRQRYLHLCDKLDLEPDRETETM